MKISFGKNFSDTVPVGRDMSFEQFCALVERMPRHHGTLDADHYARADKPTRARDKDGPWFIPASFTRPERKATCVDRICGFVCDLDGGEFTEPGIRAILAADDEPVPGSAAAAGAAVGPAGEPAEPDAERGPKYILWSSYSSTADCPKWRIFIPYSEPIGPEDHAVNYEHFQTLFGGSLDRRCGTVSQLWYLPSCPGDAPEPVVRVGGRSYFEPLHRAAAGSGEKLGIVGTLAAMPTVDPNSDLTGRGVASILDIQSALKALDPSLFEEYTEWLEMGMAIYDGTHGSREGLEIFTAWSRTVPRFGGPEVCEEKWRSFGRPTGRRITVATLFGKALEAGWGTAKQPGNSEPHGDDNAHTQQPSQSAVPAHSMLQSLSAAVQPLLIGPPVRYRAHPSDYSMQKMMEDPESGAQRWVTCIQGFKVLSFDVLKYMGQGDHSLELTCANLSGKHILTTGAGRLAQASEFREELFKRGIATSANEFKELQEMLVEWLKRVQAAQRVKKAFNNFGWMEEDGHIVGFAVGETAYLNNGTVETGIKVAGKGGAPIAKYYVPVGDPDPWRRAAAFLSSQNRPEFMAILSTAFASPLMRFSGLSGAVVSIVSSASGVGKSTALSMAQAVWGHPKDAVHSADDTALSLSSKMGFIRSLPAYWDDIKGDRNFEAFSSVLYQITQGKEKSRLTNTAQLRDVETWNLLACIAANDSIIDIVRKHSQGTDAGHARIFEMRCELKPSPADIAAAPFFAALNQNYGHAGQIYAQWLSQPHVQARIEADVKQLTAALNKQLQVTAEERFWVAAISTMYLGAKYAKELALVDFHLDSMMGCLLSYFKQLRGTKANAVAEMTAANQVSELLYQHQPTTLLISAFPGKGTGKLPPTIIRTPERREVNLVVSTQSPLIRVRRNRFNQWCLAAGYSADTLKVKLERERAIREVNTDPFAGIAPYSSGSRTLCYDIDLDVLGLQGAIDEQPAA